MEKLLSIVDIAGSVDRFNKYKATVESMLPKGADFGRYWTMYARIAQQFASDPKVSNKQSILQCMFAAAKLNLCPDPVLGQIYFIPYKGVLTYQLGYKGMIELSRRTGSVVCVRTGLVYEFDKWSYYEDEVGQHYHFEPNMTGERGRELFGWSTFEYDSGKRNTHIMESAHIDKIKKMVLARTPHSPWADSLYEPEMRKKTVLRRHWKTEPMSVEIAQAVRDEEAVERGEKQALAPEIEEIIGNTEQMQDQVDLNTQAALAGK